MLNSPVAGVMIRLRRPARANAKRRLVLASSPELKSVVSVSITVGDVGRPSISLMRSA
jgi:hypothetical protein